MVILFILIVVWFLVLYYYYSIGIFIEGIINLVMVCVGVVFVINLFDLLIRFYIDNLNMIVECIGKGNYIVFNIVVFLLFMLLFKLDFL